MNRLAIIVASGKIPRLVANRAFLQKENPLIIGLKGQIDYNYPNFDLKIVSPGRVGKILKIIKDNNCNRVIFCGKFNRPKISEILPDKTALKLLGNFFLSGDDDSLKKIKVFFEENNIKVQSIRDYLGDRIVSEGLKIGKNVTKYEIESIKVGIKVLKSLGDLDVGQSVIVQQKRVLAIECSEGTDNMIKRAKNLIDQKQKGLVFIKMSKTHQDKNQDIPVIGIKTIKNLHKSKIFKIAIEANNCIIADKYLDIKKVIEDLKMSLISVNYSS